MCVENEFKNVIPLAVGSRNLHAKIMTNLSVIRKKKFQQSVKDYRSLGKGLEKQR